MGDIYSVHIKNYINSWVTKRKESYSEKFKPWLLPHLPQTFSKAPNVDQSAAENSSQQRHHLLLFELHLTKSRVSICVTKSLSHF